MNKIFNNDKFKSYVIVHCAKTITYFNTPYIFYLLLIRTLAAEEELGSSKRVQMTLRNRAPHNPSNWSIYKHTYIKPVERGISFPEPQVGYCLFMHHFPFCVCLRNSLDYPWPAHGPPPGGARRPSAACRRSTARGRGRSGPSTPTHPRSPGQGVNDFCSSIILMNKF